MVLGLIRRKRRPGRRDSPQPINNGICSFKVRTRIAKATGEDKQRYKLGAVRVLPTRKRDRVLLQASDGSQAVCVLATGQLVQRAVGQLGNLRVQQDQRIEAYKNTTLEKRDAHHLLVEAMRMQVLPVTRLPVAVQEYERPSHPEFRDAGLSCWCLFNAVTESIKGRSLDTLPKRTQALHGLLDSACGLAA